MDVNSPPGRGPSSPGRKLAPSRDPGNGPAPIRKALEASTGDGGGPHRAVRRPATGARPKRQYRSREERRREISEAALEVLAEHGPAGWTTALLAERVGVSEATLYKHFESKAEILVTAVTEQEARTQAWIRAFTTTKRGWEAARVFLEGLVAHAAAQGGGPLVLLEHATRFPPELLEDLARTRALLMERLEGFLVGSDLEPVRVDVACMALSLATSALLDWSTGGREAPFERMARQISLLGLAFGAAGAETFARAGTGAAAGEASPQKTTRTPASAPESENDVGSARSRA